MTVGPGAERADPRAPACIAKDWSAMPIRPPKMAFSNDDLVELEWVFASVCEALEANQDRQDEEAKA